MFLGKFQLGEWLPLSLVTHNASGTPTLPDAAPTAKIVDSSGTTVDTINMPIGKSKAFITAGFEHIHRLDSDYSAGVYMIFYRWATGSGAFSGAQSQQFEIVAGGDSDGNVMGMTWMPKPQSADVVYQLDGGGLRAGRNPI